MPRAKLLLLPVVIVGLLLLAAGFSLPRLVGAMPGRVRQYLPEPVNRLAAAELPDALPTPKPDVAAAPALGILTPTSSPSATPVPTLPAEAEDAPATPNPAPTATSEPTPTATPSPVPLPGFVRLDNVPVIPQKFNNCGPTNLTIVLNHFNVDVDQFDVAAVVRPNYEDRNVSPDELVGYVRDYTELEAVALPGGDIELLRKLLAAGLPVIVEKGLDAGESIGWMGHYLTLFGYDAAGQRFLVRDTYLGPWEEDGYAAYDALDTYWRQFNRTFIVVFPPERAAEVAALLPADANDPVALWSRVAAQAEADIRTDGGDAYAWFNHGASLTELAKVSDNPEQFVAAVASFDRARRLGLPPRMLWYRFSPYEAYPAVGRFADVLDLTNATLATQGGRNVEETYLHQGHALLAMGDLPRARAAYERVVQLHPGSATAESALAALSELQQ